MKVKLTKDGFLDNPNNWNENIAQDLAATENISLTQLHWEMINILRDFYSEYQIIPPLRIFIKALKKIATAEKASSIYLYKLFPEGPMRQMSKIAGLPKPKHCL